MSRHITRAQTEALATFVTRLRPDWDHPGIVAAISKASGKGDPLDLAHALLTLAEDDHLRSPGLLTSDGRHWMRRGGKPTGPRLSMNVPCPDHPTEHDMPCPVPAAVLTDEERAELGRLWRTELAKARGPR